MPNSENETLAVRLLVRARTMIAVIIYLGYSVFRNEKWNYMYTTCFQKADPQHALYEEFKSVDSAPSGLYVSETQQFRTLHVGINKQAKKSIS